MNDFDISKGADYDPATTVVHIEPMEDVFTHWRTMSEANKEYVPQPARFDPGERPIGGDSLGWGWTVLVRECEGRYFWMSADRDDCVGYVEIPEDLYRALIRFEDGSDRNPVPLSGDGDSA